MYAGCKAILPAVMCLLVVLAVALAGGCLEASIPGDDKTAEEQMELQAQLRAELQGKIEQISDDSKVLATAIHDLINVERAQNGLDLLEWDKALADIAYAHSTDMAARDYFDHFSPEGKDFADRYEKAGYSRQTRIGDRVYVGGENLFLNNIVRSYTYDQETGEILDYIYSNLDEIARTTVQGWMESPGHRENILTPFTREGIGVYVTAEGEIYITENFS